MTTTHPEKRKLPFRWRCPTCGGHSVINHDTYQFQAAKLSLATDLGDNLWLGVSFIACANEECRQVAVTASLAQRIASTYEAAVESWSLRPQGHSLRFPDFVPAAIQQDYREAAQILQLSPRASATLSRRCLQSIIRDFWGIKKRRLVDELDAIEEKVDPEVWQAIQAVRGFGSMGAQLERDSNVLTDVSAEEARLLLQLVADLISEWYVRREEKRRRVAGLVAAAGQRVDPERQGPQRAVPGSGAGEEPDTGIRSARR